MEGDNVTIVSGLPRSGTSMMMKMLDAGGIEPLTDGIRAADEDNPQGYYEYERVKQIADDKEWLEDACGKSVKMISALLKHLPPEYGYEVIFMRRDIGEVLASQRRMLIRRGEPTEAVPDDRMAALFKMHVEQVEAWIMMQPNMRVLFVDHADVLDNATKQGKRVRDFLGQTLDVEAMAAVVDRSLYRQRR